MDCHKTLELLSGYLDNALSPSEKMGIDEHLRSCKQCSASLKELGRTVAILHDLEEITPPAWLTQKIMSRIKAESERNKKGLLQKLFFPLYIKLPIEAAGIVLIALTALYVFKTMEPEIKTEMVYSEKPVVTSPLGNQPLPKQQARQKAAQPPAPMMPKSEEKVDVTSSVGENKPSPAPAPAAAPPPGPEQPTSVREEAFRENRSEPAETKTKGTLERGLPATGGVTAHDQLKQEGSRLAAKRMSSPQEKADITLSFKATDLDAAGKDIKEILHTLGGRIMKEEPGPNDLTVVGELGSDKLLPFMQRLKILGYVKERTPTPTSDKKQVLIKIIISKP
jgi:hypothetical protein